MKRAAILIGVEKTGGLPKLTAVREGVTWMESWARNEGFETHLITDAQEPVTTQIIRKKVKELIDPSNLDQLLIYFSGHGVNIRFGEFWLLSDAPEDGDQAVNVVSAEALARRCGIPHVVLLSDACRTAAEGIQAQSVDGSAIFPNLEPTGLEKPVDLFFACTLGAPSHEIRDPNDAARRYRAVYTEELHAALRGRYPEALVRDATDGSMVLRPRPLKKLLEKKVPQRIGDLLGNPVPISQTPDARITSDDDAWLARLAEAPAPDVVRSPPRRPQALSVSSVTRDALRSVLSTAAPAREALDKLMRVDAAAVQEVVDTVQRDAAAFGPLHFETQCGFKVRGAELRQVVARSAFAEVLAPSLARVHLPDQPAADVLLELRDGRGIVLPALRDFIAALSFENGELRNVAYEPSDNSYRWPEYVARQAELTTLRSLIASNIHLGGFRLDRDDAEQLTEKIRFAKGLDPTMALYAAYSYHNLGRRDLIRRMQDYVRGDLGITFFDIALLNGERPRCEPGERQIFPFIPMLAQGWSLLEAFGVSLPDRLAPLKRSVGSSLWTILDSRGVQIVHDFLRE